MAKEPTGETNRYKALIETIFFNHWKKAETRSLTVRAAPGLLDVYSSSRDRMVMLVVRREPRDIYETRNVEMTAADARDLADKLLAAARSVD